MIILGVILLIIGFVAGLSIIWTLGVIALIIGVVLAITGHRGRKLAGRSHWY